MIIDKINEILYAWDPIELKESHVPNDEYIIEAQKIQEYLLYESDPYLIAKRIMKLFLEYFGNYCFNKSFEECLDIAKKIISLNIND